MYKLISINISYKSNLKALLSAGGDYYFKISYV